MLDVFDESADEKYLINLSIYTPKAYETAIGRGLKPEHFKNKFIGDIFQAISDAKDKFNKVDLSALSLVQRLKLEHHRILADLHAFQSTLNVNYFIDKMLSEYQQRTDSERLTRLSYQFANTKDAKNAAGIRADMRQIVNASSIDIHNKAHSKQLDSSEISKDLEMLEMINSSGQPRRGITTGIKPLDDIIRGWQAPSVYVIGARPAIGKTTLALNMFFNAAINGHHPLFISLETSREQIKTKLYSIAGGLDVSKYYDCRANDTDHDRIMRAVKRIDLLNMTINDSVGKNWEDIEIEIERTMNLYFIDVVFIDYLQLIQTTASKSKGNRYNELAHITGSVKTFALKSKIPIVYLAQLSRELEKIDRMPILSDLRDSGTIEQDADVVMFLDGKREDATRKLVVAKNRFGESNKLVSLDSCLAHSWIGQQH